MLASEFGRDAMTEGKVGKEVKDQAINIPDVMTEPRHYGMHRHFTAAGSILMFGGGIKKGFVYGKTADERPCTTIENPVVMEDLHATMYHALGIAPDTLVRRRTAAGLRDEGRQGRADPGAVRVGPAQVAHVAQASLARRQTALSLVERSPLAVRKYENHTP